jgi:hypothetical protein
MAINPLQAPTNYMAMLPQVDLGQQFAQLGQVLAQRQERESALNAQKQYAADLQSTLDNPTQKAWSSLIAKYPGQQKAFESAREGTEKVRVDNEFNEGLEMSAAFENKNIEVVKALAQKAVDARKNSGQPTGIYEQVLDALNAGNIKGAQAGVNMALSLVDPDKFKKIVDSQGAAAKAPSELTEAVAKADEAVAKATTAQATATNASERAAAEAALAKAQADKAKVEARFAGPIAQAGLALTTAQIKDINSNISTRAARLNLDAQTMQATVAEKLSSIQKNVNELPTDARKLINESAVAAAASKQSADQYNDLAKRLDVAGGGFGVATSFADYLRKATGSQSALQELRSEYIRVRNSAAIKALPPGVATDKDIQLALKGIPPENANAKTMANFLRGMGKLQDIEASVANAKTDWLSNNKGLLTRAGSTFIAGDYAVKPGETFNDFSQRIVGDVAKRYRAPEEIAEEKRQQLVNQIPTGSTPRPAAPVANIRSQADAILRGGQ